MTCSSSRSDEGKSSAASQVEWLFGLDALPFPGVTMQNGMNVPKFLVRAELEEPQDRIEFASRSILENIGVEVESSDDSYLELMLKKFGAAWPSTKDFSPFARSLSSRIDAVDDPDTALITWIDQEYVLYQTLEKHLITERLNAGFTGESGVEAFLAYSLSVQNRRKSRSGMSLEHHIEAILKLNKVAYSRGANTEAKSKPDFLFPGIDQYRDSSFPASRLHMLASKRSAKDRWRQILAESERIRVKHLLTLEAAISQSQTDEMARQNVRLVLPASIHDSFSKDQQSQLMSVKQFLELTSAAE